MREAIIVTDLGFGDSGKGSMVDYYTRLINAHTVVKVNGGAQAAHKVMLPSGKSHIFHQFGSGTFAGAATFISNKCIVDPIELLLENKKLKDLGFAGNPLDNVTIDESCKVVTPFHKALNRLREMQRGSNCHGSCGMGIGEVVSLDIAKPYLTTYMRELTNPMLGKWLENQQEEILVRAKALGVPQDNQFYEILSDKKHVYKIRDLFMLLGKNVKTVQPSHIISVLSNNVVFECSQGVLLDEWFGFHPYTTWSTTTSENAMNLLSNAGYSGKINRVGVIRAYATRHGPGPFPTFDSKLTERLPDSDNFSNQWQKNFRVGWLDLVLTRYAIKVNGGIDALAVTCLDRMLPSQAETWVCNRYGDIKNLEIKHKQDKTTASLTGQEELGRWLIDSARPVYTRLERKDLVSYIARELDVRIRTVSSGPCCHNKHEIPREELCLVE